MKLSKHRGNTKGKDEIIKWSAKEYAYVIRHWSLETPWLVDILQDG